MRTFPLRAFCLFLFAASLPGCVTQRDVSIDPQYSTGYKVGAVYRLKKPIFAKKSGQTIFDTYSGLMLFHPGDSSTPLSVQDYDREPAKWEAIAGVARPGTLIRIEKIQFEDNPENGKSVWIHGRLIDVPWAKKPAELAFISKDVRQHELHNIPTLDPEVLELVPGM